MKNNRTSDCKKWDEGLLMHKQAKKSTSMSPKEQNTREIV